MKKPISYRNVLLTLGLFAITATTIVIGSMSATITAVSDKELQNYWRTTYDILVRPKDSKTDLENKYSLLESNYLSQLSGGISYEQYQAILGIPDIEVAAPVAKLKYIQRGLHERITLPSPPANGVLLYEYIESTDDDGIEPNTDDTDFFKSITSSQHYKYFHFYGAPTDTRLDTNFRVNEDIYLRGTSVGFLLAAVDPVQEAALYHLDEAIYTGEYLPENDEIFIDELSSPLGKDTRINNVPIIINSHVYSKFDVTELISEYILPDSEIEIEEIVDKGGEAYLSQFPARVIFERNIDWGEATKLIVDSFFNPFTKGTALEHYSLGNEGPGLPRKYVEEEFSFETDFLSLEIIPPEFLGNKWEDVEKPIFNLKAYGMFDIGLLPTPGSINQVPLETYYPPTAVLKFDKDGNPVEPREIKPKYLGSGSFIASPPTMLTTIDAARLITGDDCSNCISVIRVRVAGIEELNEESQEKIEAIASEIASSTGLDVDIMVSTSPTSVLVHVPGVGYIEEQWIQKNVSIQYKQTINKGHILLIAAVFGIAGLFVLDFAWGEVITHRERIALQKALGWRSATVFHSTLQKTMSIGVVAAVLGTGAGWLIAAILLDAAPMPSLLAAVPSAVVLITILAGLYPAWKAANLPPQVGFQKDVNYSIRSNMLTAFRNTSIYKYILAGITRRWNRTMLGVFTTILSSILLVVLLGVTFDRYGMMSGTLLGEYILVRIQAFHYTIVIVGFALAVLSITNSLTTNVLERRREIGVFKVLGWKTETIRLIFLVEGMLVGLLGGVIGSLVGLSLFLFLYQSISTNLIIIGIVGLLSPVVVGLLASIYPSALAAKVLPAENIRAV